ncbi:galectin-4-like [Anastrepha obliqua]|uniref:galectin-4-like n=1 Tax=Anastrepha obliqua TaxID=95512 RepID=UPI002409CCFF|nr:galectin-4-like [Anastrepha obliqua]
MGNSQRHTKRSLVDWREDYILENAKVVYENKELGVLKEGVCFNVTGHILLTCERFSINFLVDNEAADIALSLNVRLPHNFIVRNSRVKNRWLAEQSASSLPFSLRRGQDFIIQVLITESAFLISVNGLHYAVYLHCMPYTLITSLAVKGDVKDVKMNHALVSFYPDRFGVINTVTIIHKRGGSPKKLAKSIYEEETAKKLRWSPSIALRAVKWQHEVSPPYVARLPKNIMSQGRFLKIEGRVKLLPTSFYISLQKSVYFWPHPIVAFHLGARFSNKAQYISKATIMRRAWYDGKWSPKECTDIDTEFLPGKIFRLAIICEEDAYEVYLNGKYLLEFKYHMTPEVVDTLYIRGDIKLLFVSLHRISEDEASILEYFTGKRESFVQRRFSNGDNSDSTATNSYMSFE